MDDIFKNFIEQRDCEKIKRLIYELQNQNDSDYDELLNNLSLLIG